jgi:hypothetical protein
MKKNIDELTAEIKALDKKREKLTVDSFKWKSNANKANKLSIELRIIKDAERGKPIFRTEGRNTFHVLSQEDLEAIWRASGVRKPLVRVVNMPYAKYGIKRGNGLVIYLDVKPAAIFISTNIL